MCDKKEGRGLFIIGIMIIALFVVCTKSSMDYEDMKARVVVVEAIVENDRERLDFFELMDEALTVGVAKHRHYENGEVYLGEPKECKKYCE